MSGNLCLYWNDNVMISKHKLNKKRNLEWYKKQSNKFIIDGMKQGTSFDKVKESCIIFCNIFSLRRKDKKKVSAEDHFYFLNCILFLIKIGFYNEDDKLYCFYRKSKKHKH